MRRAPRDGRDVSGGARNNGSNPSPPVVPAVSPTVPPRQRVREGELAGEPLVAEKAMSIEGVVMEAAATAAAVATKRQGFPTVNEEGNPRRDAPGDVPREADNGVALAPAGNSAGMGDKNGGDDGPFYAVVSSGHLRQNTVIAGRAEAEGPVGSPGAAAAAAAAVEEVATGRPTDGNPGCGCFKGGGGDGVAVAAEDVLYPRPEQRKTVGLDGSRKGQDVLQQGLVGAPPPTRRGQGGEALVREPGVRGTALLVPPPQDATGTPEMVREELEKISRRARQALGEVEVDADLVHLGDILGSGSFAEVRRGRLVVNGGGASEAGKAEEVAVKVLRDSRRSTLKRLWCEVLIMKDLEHPNIVRLLGATWRGPRLMMILEYVSRGNLATVLEESHRAGAGAGPLSWPDQKFEMCLDIAAGMAYLHRFKHFDDLSSSMQDCVIHRDLKPQNLLVTHDYRVKITDFGAATGRGDDPRDTQVGTLLYIAPEIVRGDCYDERCDVYSFALVLLAMLELREDIITVFAEEVVRRETGTGVTGGDTATSTTAGRGAAGGGRGGLTHMAITNKIVNEGLRPTLPHDMFATMKILIEQCWAPIPALRPTFEEILEFLQTIARDEIIEGHPLEDEPDTMEPTCGITLDVVSAPNVFGDEIAGDSLVRESVPATAAAAAGTALVARTSDAAVAGAAAADGPGGAGASTTPRSRCAEVAGVEEAVPQGVTTPPQRRNQAEGNYGASSDQAFEARSRPRKRGKNFVPVKGSTGMEFLEFNNGARLAVLA
ncbi:unnamed protein product, partial [Scytosiphon promiscuus]